mgnify:CR=1 FL=1
MLSAPAHGVHGSNASPVPRAKSPESPLERRLAWGGERKTAQAEGSVWAVLSERLAATYSPTASPLQYHPRCEA